MQNFYDLLAIGQDGEHEVAELLINKGAKVLPLYQFDPTHAPYIIEHNSIFISPDLICFNSGKCYFAEVKTKNQWVEYKGVVETGLDKRLYEQYKMLKDATNINVYLFFNHKKKDPTGIYYCELDQYTRIWDGNANGHKAYNPMVFYEKNILKKIDI